MSIIKDYKDIKVIEDRSEIRLIYCLLGAAIISNFIIAGMYADQADEIYAFKNKTHQCLIRSDFHTTIQTECRIISEAKND